MQTRRRHLLPGEKLFPIYRFCLEYTVEYPTKYWKDTTESMEVDYMSPQPMTAQEIDDHLQKLWLSLLTSTRYSKRPLADKGAKLIAWEVSLHRYDNWVLRWFQHETRNVYLSDRQLLESFQRFVNRKREADFNLNVLCGLRQEGVDYYCLMGAEDKWRWKGPCRCEHCIEQGVVRIDH